MKIWTLRTFAFLALFAGLVLGYYLYTSQDSKPFELGLDLSGGSRLEYSADISGIPSADIDDRMEALREIIERRVNVLGVSEPVVQTETARLGQDGVDHRLIVELPGITDIDEAIRTIGQTPTLEFKIENPEFDANAVQLQIKEAIANGTDIQGLNFDFPEQYLDTELTGRYLKRARVEFTQGVAQGTQNFGQSQNLTGTPYISIAFDGTGGDLFEKITGENVGKTIAIYLDSAIISAPVVQTAIAGGEAVITGSFTPEEARELVGRLNSGALPIPIGEPVSVTTIGPSLGTEAINAGIYAGILGFIFVVLYMVLWYRLPGFLGSVALLFYAILTLSLFKVIPVTLTAAGIAGFIISIGIAVDGNILIFERMKEEVARGRTIYDATRIGFNRAWPSIRDSNISSLISAVILYWFGSALIQGFALTFGIGVLVSMFSAITITRLFLFALAGKGETKLGRFIFNSGIN